MKVSCTLVSVAALLPLSGGKALGGARPAAAGAPCRGASPGRMQGENFSPVFIW